MASVTMHMAGGWCSELLCRQACCCSATQTMGSCRAKALQALFGIRMLVLPGEQLYKEPCFYLVGLLCSSWKEDPKVGSWLTASVHSSATTGAGGTSSLTCSPQRDMLKCSAGDFHDGEKLPFSGLILQTGR